MVTGSPRPDGHVTRRDGCKHHRPFVDSWNDLPLTSGLLWGIAARDECEISIRAITGL